MHLFLNYEGFKDTLENGFEIPEPSLAIIHGESGSSKSVLIKHIATQKSTFFLLEDSYPLLNYKVSELLSLTQYPFKTEADFIEHMDQYFDFRPFLNKRLKNLSGGEKSIISLNFALYSKK